MEELIRQAFIQVKDIGPHVQEGHYDLLGPNGEIILPTVWDTVVEPDWTVSMHMWPMPEPEKPPEEPLPPLDIIDLDAMQGPGKRGKGKGTKKSRPSAFSFRPPAPPPPPPPPTNPGPDPLVVIPSNTSASKVDKAPKKTGPSKPAARRGVSSTGLSSWMLGGGTKPAKGPQKALKEIKKPDSAAGSQHGSVAANAGTCTVM